MTSKGLWAFCTNYREEGHEVQAFPSMPLCLQSFSENVLNLISKMWNGWVNICSWNLIHKENVYCIQAMFGFGSQDKILCVQIVWSIQYNVDGEGPTLKDIFTGCVLPSGPGYLTTCFPTALLIWKKIRPANLACENIQPIKKQNTRQRRPWTVEPLKPYIKKKCSTFKTTAPGLPRSQRLWKCS